MTDEKIEEPAPIHALTIVPFEFEDNREKHWCRHNLCSFTVNKAERSCRCKVCGGEVDPYVAIQSVAESWEQWAVKRKNCESRAKAAGQRLAELERSERNCRQRIDRLHKKVMDLLPPDLAEAIFLLKSHPNRTHEWMRRRDDLLAKYGC